MMDPTRYRPGLPQLHIPTPLTSQQPIAFDNRQPMFSPALPSTLQNTFHPPFPVNNMPMQTPTMQTILATQPSAIMAHRSHGSLAHITGMGVQPQLGLPLHGIGPIHGRHLSLAGVSGFVPSLPPPRSRRQPSIGGPPKAVLGGPARKSSPLPPTAAPTSATSNVKAKKITVNLPKETIPGTNGMPPTHPPWTRTPLDPSLVPDDQDIFYPELTSVELYPPESWLHTIPPTMAVFLPPKSAWDLIKQQLIEEKLEKLGVEKGSGSSVPHIYAPHARAASISSPADPALLIFKLNKLHQTQTVSSLSSGATSPLPPFALSPSPHQPLPRFQKHSHSVSLAQPLTLQLPSTGSPAALNPFGPSATLGSDLVVHRGSPGHSPGSEGQDMHSPQNRVLPTLSSFAPPRSAFIDNRPNFALGFGLDIPEEEEPLEAAARKADADSRSVGGSDSDDEESFDDTELDRRDGSTTAPHSRYHSRHVSRLSAALSLRSVGGRTEGPREEGDIVPARSPIPVPDIDDLDQDAVGEWTGSEDVYMGSLEPSEDESTGEWSNPSDEERVRQARAERRLRGRAQDIEVPRRIPNFPHPPQNTMIRSLRRIDDIISNPSEDDNVFEHGMRAPERSPASQRPLPPLPHSRVASGQISAHDPANAHSRGSSIQEPPLRRNSLNPFAKPFVFGPQRDSISIGSAPPTAIHLPTFFGHIRLASLGTPLNAAAQEFKPTGFTFRPPPGVPQMTMPPIEVVRPLPIPPKSSTPVRAQQGREKRQRRESRDSSDGEGPMSSFRFPGPRGRRKSLEPGLTSPQVEARQNSLISSSDEFVPAPADVEESNPMLYSSTMANNGSPDETLRDEGTVKIEKSIVQPNQQEDAAPASVKVKRAPVPLDFKQTSNTIPASVFKALATGDEKTRRTVRSRLDSRDIYEHVRLSSLDDLTMPPIAGKVSRNPDTNPKAPREVGDSAISIPAVDLSVRFEQQRLEHKIQEILDEKMETFYLQVLDKLKPQTQPLNSSTEAMIKEVISSFRIELQESATQHLDDSRMDARGELDFELLNDVVRQGQTEMKEVLQSKLKDLVERIEDLNEQGNVQDNIKDFIERLYAKTTTEFTAAMSRFSDRISTIEHPLEKGKIANEVAATLTPVLASLRSEPVDYEYLTAQLTQAVKPHISQLIDLASDKRETASLIVDRLLPLLPRTSAIDVDAIARHLIAEIRRLITPIDPFEIKEQVADLVVERLDARLALRDRTFNVDTISAKVNEGVTRLLEPVQSVNTTLQDLTESQKRALNNDEVLRAAHAEALKTISDLPPKLVAATEAFQAAEAAMHAKIESLVSSSTSTDTVSEIKSSIDSLADSQKKFLGRYEGFLTTQKDVQNRLDALPDAFAAAATSLQESSAVFTSSHEAFQREAEDLRKLNAEHQAQLAKARSAHGQARVEKDMLSENLAETRSERDALRAQVKEMQEAAASQSSEAAALRAKIAELEEGLKRGLEQLKGNDMATQINHKRISETEKTNREMTAEKQSLISKVELLEYQVAFAKRDKEASERTLAVLQQQYDQLLSQESRRESVQLASDKLDLLTGLMEQGNSEELKSLRQIRDRCRVLEAEHTALQRRSKDQDSKVANSERVAAIARQSLTAAQQRASEWETRAQGYEARLEKIQTQLEQAEQVHAQLDTDYSLASLQLEEQQAENRLAKERENAVRERVSSLEREVARLQSELEQANNAPSVLPNGGLGSGYRPTNGNYFPHLRSSASFSSRSGTPVLQANGRIIKKESPSYTPSVRDSVHAPSSARGSTSKYSDFAPGTPKAGMVSGHRASAPSPTPSTVSLTPTADGWYLGPDDT